MWKRPWPQFRTHHFRGDIDLTIVDWPFFIPSTAEMLVIIKWNYPPTTKIREYKFESPNRESGRSPQFGIMTGGGSVAIEDAGLVWTLSHDRGI